MIDNSLKDIMELKLYLLTQTQRLGYDTYDSCIVASESSTEAKKIHPSGETNKWHYGTWADSPENVTATLIGNAHSTIEKGLILSSFVAG